MKSDCSDKLGDERKACLDQLIEYHSYKLVKSLFNFGKASIYNGLWRLRYEHAEPDLFDQIFNSTLERYNDPAYLGALSYAQLFKLANFTLASFAPYRETEKMEFEYSSIPSLKCPVTCTYELLTWQTLFYTSIAIFVLALVAIALYSIFLTKQYKSMKKRLKSIRVSKSNLKLTDMN